MDFGTGVRFAHAVHRLADVRPQRRGVVGVRGEGEYVSGPDFRAVLEPPERGRGHAHHLALQRDRSFFCEKSAQLFEELRRFVRFRN